MELIQKAIVRFNRCYFIYNPKTKDVRVVPTEVLPNSESTTWFDPSCEEKEEADTIDELMVKFESLGLIMPEEDVWDLPERPLRLAIPNDYLTEIIKQMPTIIGTLDILKDYIIVRNRTQFIYLQEIYPDDRVVFANYIQERP